MVRVRWWTFLERNENRGGGSHIQMIIKVCRLVEPPKAIFGVVSIRRRLTAHCCGIATVANPSQCYSILQFQKKRIIKLTDNLMVRKSLRLDAPVLKDCESLSDTECVR